MKKNQVKSSWPL